MSRPISQRIPNWEQLLPNLKKESYKEIFSTVQRALEKNPDKSLQSIFDEFNIIPSRYYDVRHRALGTDYASKQFSHKIKKPDEAPGLLELPIPKISEQKSTLIKVFMIQGTPQEMASFVKSMQ